MDFMDIRIIFGRVSHEFRSPRNHPKVQIHSQRKIRRIQKPGLTNALSNFRETIVPARGPDDDVFTSFQRHLNILGGRLWRGKFNADVDVGACERSRIHVAIDFENLLDRIALLQRRGLDFPAHLSVTDQSDPHASSFLIRRS